MPRIELIPEVLYGPNDPIHWETDNVPLKNIIKRQNLINLALDDALEQLRDAIGTQGSVANRLNQSIKADGSLKKSAIDDTTHSIEEHEDTANYVRMSKAQSDKLDTVSKDATDVSIRVFTDNTNFTKFDSGGIDILPSSTVTPDITSPNKVKFDLSFPASAAHKHFYGLVPVASNLSSPDYTNYKVNSSSTAFIEDSLRVHINGVRIFEDQEVYVPGDMVDDPWTLLKFTPDHSNGTFELSAAISEDDIIRIDFDISLV